ncbi:glycoside hydrolase superfamily [Aspergillus venezuelensis]
MSNPALPHDFRWGFATASYQVEGAVAEDGRLPSIWDKFCEKAGKIQDGTSGAVACDSYNKTAEDIKLLKQTGAQWYRFSVAWPRIIPLGGKDDPINPAGIQHYVQFVDDLVAAGITPVVTLYHWDLPEALDRRYGGLLDKDEFIADFTNYARVVFTALAPKVKHWITFNEPYCSAIFGYGTGMQAPGRTSDRTKNAQGDSSTEPWIVGHNILLAHAHAVNLFRREFQPQFGGEVGITLNSDFAFPFDASRPKDHAAAQRRMEFSFAWLADPLYRGEYPECMRKQLGSRLPSFAEDERELLRGSTDFLGLNHYTSVYATDCTGPVTLEDYTGGTIGHQENSRGDFIGPETQSTWLRPNSDGFRNLLRWISTRYDRPKIYVTENGTCVKNEHEMSREMVLNDDFRVAYFRSYIRALAQAVTEDGVDCRAYMAWSLLDNFEWSEGYKTRFGLVFVDYDDDQKRYLKKSATELKGIFDQYLPL